MNIEHHIKSFRDWSFSRGRPRFADDWGEEEHTRFCLEFLRHQTTGRYGITGPIAVFEEIMSEVSNNNIHREIDFLIGYYIYMNRHNEWGDRANVNTYKRIKINIEQIRKVMVLL